jgi:hypothetical protein
MLRVRVHLTVPSPPYVCVSCAWLVNGSSGLDELSCGWFSGGLTAGGAAALESSAGSMLIALLAVLGVDLIVLVVVLIAVLVRRH